MGLNLLVVLVAVIASYLQSGSREWIPFQVCHERPWSCTGTLTF